MLLPWPALIILVAVVTIYLFVFSTHIQSYERQIKHGIGLGMVAPTGLCRPRTWEAKQEDFEFKASLGSIMSSRQD